MTGGWGGSSVRNKGKRCVYLESNLNAHKLRYTLNIWENGIHTWYTAFKIVHPACMQGAPSIQKTRDVGRWMGFVLPPSSPKLTGARQWELVRPRPVIVCRPANPVNNFTLLQRCHNMTFFLWQRYKVTLQQRKFVDSQITMLQNSVIVLPNYNLEIKIALNFINVRSFKM